MFEEIADGALALAKSERFIFHINVDIELWQHLTHTPTIKTHAQIVSDKNGKKTRRRKLVKKVVGLVSEAKKDEKNTKNTNYFQ